MRLPNPTPRPLGEILLARLGQSVVLLLTGAWVLVFANPQPVSQPAPEPYVQPVQIQPVDPGLTLYPKTR
jgi:hypothetical protein